MSRVAKPASLPPADQKLVVVEASAGTGKTYFLEHRVVDLILAGAELGQILLVTFTDKAVAELRLRIRDLLDRLARDSAPPAADGAPHWEIDDDARRRLRAAVTSFDHAPIYTIHGFCHRVLIEDAFAARRLFEQTQVADEVAFDAAFSALLREQFARVAPAKELLVAFLETDRTVDDLRDVLLACARADAQPRRYFDADTARAIAVALHAALGTDEQRSEIIKACAANGNQRNWLTGWLSDVGAAFERLELVYALAEAPAPRLLALLDELREPLEKMAKYVAASPAHAQLSALLRRIAGTLSLDEAIAAELLPPIMARVAADKSARGLFDYDDMLELVWEALCGPRRAELAARLRDRTPWVMIDEFQDTDPVQWNIFRTVWMHPEARGLTIVGDPKQAIYSFRGADVQTYLAAREEMLRAGAARVPLAVNRRSTPQLVAAVNKILLGAGPLPSPMFDKDIKYDEPVEAGGDVLCDDARAPVSVLALEARVAKPSSESVRAALADAIGDGIDALRAQPPAWTSRGTAQPFALGQVMVLTRSNRDSSEIAAALRARGLPCALVEPEKLFATREAAELSYVLAAIASPRDRSARMRALRTRFFDVPWAELMQVVDAPDHHAAIARIFDWAQLAARRAYEPLFRRLVEDSRYAERALVLGGGERAVTNTWHLIELLLAEVARSRSDLHELVVQLRRWIADDGTHTDERDIQRAETDADAIRVLTVHKAKGLEAPYVFVYGGTSGPPPSRVHALRDAAGRALVVGKPDAATAELLEADADAENQRLAYVALTRAQVRLYVPLYTESVLRKGAAYEVIQRCLQPWVKSSAPAKAAKKGKLEVVRDEAPPVDAAGFEVVPVPIGADEVAPPPADALAGYAAPPAPPSGEPGALPTAQAGLAMLSYTRLAHDAAVAAVALPVRVGDALALDRAELDVDDTVGEVGPNELPPGASAGLMLHDVLEVAELDAARAAPTPDEWARDPIVARQLASAARARGIDARFLPHAAELAHKTLVQPLALADGESLPPLAAATALAREVEFGYPIPGTARGLVKGFIDALVAWDDDLWVLDYKSDLLAGEDLLAAARRRVDERYVVQARLYALAADRVRGGRRLAGLLFAFVRHGVVVPIRLPDAERDEVLAAWADWLARVATEVAA